MSQTILPIELTRHLEKGEILPVYYLYGDEPFFIEEAIRDIEQRVISPDFKDFNYEIFYGSDKRVSEIIIAANTMPVMSTKRLVVVKEASQFSATDLEEFTSYLSNPSPFACLVLIGEKPNLRAKVFTSLQKCGVIAQLNHPKERDLPYWIQKLSRGLGKKISKDATTFLIELVGNSLQQMHNEIEKVSIFIGGKGTIEIEDIEAVVSDLKVESIFDLIDSVGNKNMEKALLILKKMLASREDHLMILGMIMHRFRLIFRAKEMLQKGIASPDVGEKLEVKPFYLKKLLKQVEQFSFDDLRDAFDHFFSTDLALKTSRVVKKEILLERLTIDLCQNKKGERK